MAGPPPHLLTLLTRAARGRLNEFHESGAARALTYYYQGSGSRLLPLPLVTSLHTRSLQLLSPSVFPLHQPSNGLG